MADTQSAKYAFTLTVAEVKDLGLDLVSNPTITHTIGSDSATLTASTTVPVTKTFSDTIALSGGSSSLDLTTSTGSFSQRRTVFAIQQCCAHIREGYAIQSRDDQ